MIAVVTILAAFPLGFFLRNRLAANTAYAIAYLWAFVFQSLYLLLDSINESTNPAFEPTSSRCPTAWSRCRSSWSASGWCSSATASAAVAASGVRRARARP